MVAPTAVPALFAGPGLTGRCIGVMPAGEVIASTHDLWHVEQSFRMSKTDLRARSMFHRTEDGLEAHLTIVFTALALSREAQIRQLRPLRSGTIAINGTKQTFPLAIPADKQAVVNAIRNPRASTKPNDRSWAVQTTQDTATIYWKRQTGARRAESFETRYGRSLLGDMGMEWEPSKRNDLVMKIEITCTPSTPRELPPTWSPPSTNIRIDQPTRIARWRELTFYNRSLSTSF